VWIRHRKERRDELSWRVSTSREHHSIAYRRSVTLNVTRNRQKERWTDWKRLRQRTVADAVKCCVVVGGGGGGGGATTSSRQSINQSRLSSPRSRRLNSLQDVAVAFWQLRMPNVQPTNDSSTCLTSCDGSRNSAVNLSRCYLHATLASGQGVLQLGVYKCHRWRQMRVICCSSSNNNEQHDANY